MKKIRLVREELRLKELMKRINIFVITFERKLFNVILFQTREMAESHFCVVFFFGCSTAEKHNMDELYSRMIKTLTPFHFKLGKEKKKAIVL